MSLQVGLNSFDKRDKQGDGVRQGPNVAEYARALGFLCRRPASTSRKKSSQSGNILLLSRSTVRKSSLSHSEPHSDTDSPTMQSLVFGHGVICQSARCLESSKLTKEHGNDASDP